MTKLRLFTKYVERYLERRMPIWDRELNDMCFTRLGLQDLPTIWKIGYAVAVLSLLSSFGLIVCFCMCLRYTAKNLEEKELIREKRREASS